MAITIDNTATYLFFGGGASAGSHSWDHTCSGSDRALFVVVGTDQATVSVSSMTYNGVAMSLVRRQANNFGGPQCMTEMWKLSNPDTGTHTIQVNLSSSVGLIAGSVSVNGAHQTTSSLTGTATGTNTTSDTPTLNPVSDVGDLIIDGFFHGTDTTTDSAPNAGQTQRFNRDSGGVFPSEVAASTKDATSPNTSIGWNMAGSNFLMTYVAAAIKPAAATGWGELLSDRRNRIIKE